AIARGELGTLYVGVNVEFAGMPLSCSVHAEQAAVSNARRHRERRIVALATSAVPCGHCRQFLHELPRAAEIRILQPGAAAASPGEPLPRATAVTLGELLPHAFSPHDLGAAGDLLDERRTELVRDDGSDDELLDAARAAAERAYVPYGRTHSGVALRTADGAIHRGSALESVAYKPSLPPLQDALVSLRQTGRCRRGGARRSGRPGLAPCACRRPRARARPSAAALRARAPQMSEIVSFGFRSDAIAASRPPASTSTTGSSTSSTRPSSASATSAGSIGIRASTGAPARSATSLA